MWVLVCLAPMLIPLGSAAGSFGFERRGVRVYQVDLVPYATTVLRFGEGVRYVATGWPYVQVQVLEGALVLLRPLVKEGEGELWVMLQDGREYRLRLVVREGVIARTYRFF